MPQTKQEMQSVDQLDPNLRLQKASGESWQWISPFESPVQIAGFPWLEKEKLYRRLPENPRWPLPPAVDALANCTAGGQLRFSTRSPRLALRVRLAAPASMYHMPATGQCGFDCYIGAPGEQEYFSTTPRYDHSQREYEGVMFDADNDRDLKNITLNFPLYQGVEELWIGVEPEAKVLSYPPYEPGGRVVFYGTSITQGGCAARPGMAFTNILSRRINREFINLGFSGNGKGEPELAHIISEIPDVSCYVLDYDANVASVESMRTTLLEFIPILRASHPKTPILVVSRIPSAKERYEHVAHKKRLEKSRIQRETVTHFQSQGDRNISFIDGETLLGDAYLEATVDGSHPTDLGFWLMANSLEPILKNLLTAPTSA